jgi:drug/metabolite transporter (DMT)-like permease
METPIAALVLLLVSSIAWSGLDLTRKLLAARMRPLPLLVLLSALPTPIYVAWMVAEGAPAVGAAYWLPGLASVALNVAANLAFLRSVGLSPLSATIPLLSLTPAFAALLAIPLLGELPAARQWGGIVAVVAGAFLLNARHGEAGSLGGLWSAFRREPGVPLMAAVAFLWSAAPVLDKLAMLAAGAPFHATVLNAGVAAVTLLLLAASRRLGELRGWTRSFGGFAAAVVFSVLGLGGQLLALRVIEVGIVETVKRGLGFTLAVALGRLVFGEPVTRNKLLAVALMAAGVALILI